ncbi:MAG: bifunctional phosphoglucose/phosphomannose isomerase [Acidobacteria bacterium]|nr:bifunctional phosphoglucose/phosphomannose isomerase [Acidobacteriota bacterium]
MNDFLETDAARLLSDVGSMRRLDAGAMLAILEESSDRIRRAGELARNFDPGDLSAAQNVVITGLGGSAIGGEAVQSLVAGRCRVPLSVNREYRVPAFVGAQSLVVACSYSGNTAETLAAYRSARARRARLIAITSGGQLSEEASRDGVPLLRIPGGSPPRTAIAYSVLPLLWILDRAGLCAWNEEAAEEAARVTASELNLYRPDREPAANPAKQIALQLRGRLPVIYAASDPLGAVATRWKGQISENAKGLAWHHVLPEMTHNEIVGWEHPELIRQTHVLCLRDPEESPQVAAAFEFLVQRLRSVPVPVGEYRGKGDSLLARLFSLILLGDYVSVYLAFLYAEDPTPVVIIDRLKQALKRGG